VSVGPGRHPRQASRRILRSPGRKVQGDPRPRRGPGYPHDRQARPAGGSQRTTPARAHRAGL